MYVSDLETKLSNRLVLSDSVLYEQENTMYSAPSVAHKKDPGHFLHNGIFEARFNNRT